MSRARVCMLHVLRWLGGKGQGCNRVGVVIRSLLRGDMNGKGSICLAASEDLNLAA